MKAWGWGRGVTLVRGVSWGKGGLLDGRNGAPFLGAQSASSGRANQVPAPARRSPRVSASAHLRCGLIAVSVSALAAPDAEQCAPTCHGLPYLSMGGFWTFNGGRARGGVAGC